MSTKQAKPVRRPRAGVTPSHAPAHDVDTRERLITAATRLFAEHGYRTVSVREICSEAGANVSAVNYHFAGKLGLYREVVSRAIQTIQAGSADLIFAADDVAPEERIRHYVRAYVPLVAGHKPRLDAARVSWIHKLMRHETSEPTPLAKWIADQAITPRVQYLGRAVAEILRCPLDDARVTRCVISIQTQCQFYAPDKFRDAVYPNWPPNAAELTAVAEHIAEFSLAGIRQIAAHG